MSDFMEALKTQAETPVTSLKDMAKEEAGGSGARAFYFVSPYRLGIEEGFNPRDISTRSDYIDHLAKDIAQKGVLQPLIIRMDGGKAIIVDGECRWRGALRAIEHYGAELKSIPVREEAKGTDAAKRLANVVSVYNNSNHLTPLEQSKAVARIIGMGWTHDVVAKEFSVSRERIYQLLDIAALPADVKREIKEGTISSALAVQVVKEQGEQEGAKAIVEAAKAVKGKTTKGKKGKQVKVKPAQVQTKKTRDPNAKDKDMLKRMSKAVAEEIEVLKTLWLAGKHEESSGGHTMRWTKDKFDRITKRLGIL